MLTERRLIDANPIMKFIVDGLNNLDKSKAFGYDAIQILAEIEFSPIVDAAPVIRAKWEKDPNERRTNGHIYDYRCSECHGPAHKGCYGNKDYCTSYCHHCGAKMDLEE